MARLAFPDIPRGPLYDLVSELHLLHARAGRPSLNEIVARQDRSRHKRDHFGRDSVHRLFSRCREAPPLPLLYEVVRILAAMAPAQDLDKLWDKFDCLWLAAERYDALRLSGPDATFPQLDVEPGLLGDAELFWRDNE